MKKDRGEKKEFIPLALAAEEIGRNRRTIERWIQSGKFKAYKLGKYYMIERNYLEDWKKKNFVEVA